MIFFPLSEKGFSFKLNLNFFLINYLKYIYLLYHRKIGTYNTKSKMKWTDLYIFLKCLQNAIILCDVHGVQSEA